MSMPESFPDAMLRVTFALAACKVETGAKIVLEAGILDRHLRVGDR